MLCKYCDDYNSIPGMKWGLCDLRRSETAENKIHAIITGPDRNCMCRSKIKAEKEKANEQRAEALYSCNLDL